MTTIRMRQVSFLSRYFKVKGIMTKKFVASLVFLIVVETTFCQDTRDSLKSNDDAVVFNKNKDDVATRNVAKTVEDNKGGDVQTRFFTGNTQLDAGLTGAAIGVGGTLLVNALLNDNNRRRCRYRRDENDAQLRFFNFGGNNNDCPPQRYQGRPYNNPPVYQQPNYNYPQNQYRPQNGYNRPRPNYYPQNDYHRPQNDYHRPQNGYYRPQNYNYRPQGGYNNYDYDYDFQQPFNNGGYRNSGFRNPGLRSSSSSSSSSSPSSFSSSSGILRSQPQPNKEDSATATDHVSFEPRTKSDDSIPILRSNSDAVKFE